MTATNSEEVSELGPQAAVTIEQYVELVKVVQAIAAQIESEDKRIDEKLARAVTDAERRTDEVISHKFNDLDLRLGREHDEMVDAINKLSEGMQIIAKRTETPERQKPSDLISEALQLFKQVRELRDPPQDPLTTETQSLSDIVARGVVRELNSDLKLRARNLYRKGRIQAQEVISAGVDGIIDKATDQNQHARI